MSEGRRPLEGIRVLELASIVAGLWHPVGHIPQPGVVPKLSRAPEDLTLAGRRGVSERDMHLLRQGGEGTTDGNEISARGTEAFVQRQHKTP